MEWNLRVLWKELYNEIIFEMHDRPWCLDTVHVSFQGKTAHFNPFTINKGQRYNHENYQPITTSTCECCICYELLKQQLLSDPLWAFSNISLSYPILHDFHLAYGTINNFFAILSIPFCFTCSKILFNCLTFQSVDYEHT
jgi:hypothetical protein